MSEPRSPIGSTLAQVARIFVLGVAIAVVALAGYLGLAYFGI